MKILEQTFEERLASWLEDSEFRENYERLENPCAISLKTILFIPAEKARDVFAILLHDEEALQKWQDMFLFLCQRCETDILIKGAEGDIL